MRRFALLAVVVLLGGCAPPFRVRHPGTRVEGTDVTWKRVVDKREPSWLVAADQSTCTVDKDRYQRTDLGDAVLCAWRFE